MIGLSFAVVVAAARRVTSRRMASRARAACGVVMVWLAAALLGSCGDDRDAPTLPPGGVFESQLEGSHQALTLENTAVYDLEAAGTREGDSGHEEGVDEVPYEFDQPVDLTLEVGAELVEPITLVLLDEPSGVEIARVEPGDEAPTVPLEPGRYVLQLHHPHAGDVEAEDLTIFVAPTVDSRAAIRQDLPRGHGMANANLAKLTAGQNCIGCDLRGVKMHDVLLCANSECALPQSMVVDLSGADFSGARLSKCTFGQTRFSGTKFDDAQFDDVAFINVLASAASFRGTRFSNTSRILDVVPALPQGTLQNADFTGAFFNQGCLGALDMRGATFAGTVFDSTSFVARSNFAGADLSGAVFDGADIFGMRGCGGVLLGLPARLADAIFSDGERGVTFRHVDLTGQDFTAADMRGATFACVLDERTVFDGTDLSGASFAGSDLSRANLSVAVLSETTSFVGATLSDGASRGVNLAGHHFPQTTQFKGVDLSYANLTNATLNEADLSGTLLNGADLFGANLNFANLHGAKLRGARLGVAPGSGFATAKLRGAFMTDVDLTDADLRSADLTDAHLYGDTTVTQLVRVRLDSASLVGAVLSGAILSGSLTNAVFNDAQLVNAIFNGADLTNAKFDNAYLEGADFSNALSVGGVTLSNAAVATMPGTWMFMEQDGTPFTLLYGATNLGALATARNVICPDGGTGPCNTAARLMPVRNGPFPPQPACVPRPPHFDNCLRPMPGDS